MTLLPLVVRANNFTIAEWENVTVSFEPWDSNEQYPWPAGFDPNDFSFGAKNLVIVNKKNRAQAEDNLPVHQLQRIYRAQGPDGARMYDLRLETQDGTRYLALQSVCIVILTSR